MKTEPQLPPFLMPPPADWPPALPRTRRLRRAHRATVTAAESGLVGVIALSLGIAIAPAIWRAVPILTAPQPVEVVK